jgi:hypothetical protein
VKCAECSSQRWQIYVAKWKDDRLVKDWRPLDRASWSFMQPPTISAALASKVIRPCPACNLDGYAPWSRRSHWAVDGVAADVQSEGTPF